MGAFILAEGKVEAQGGIPVMEYNRLFSGDVDKMVTIFRKAE